MLPKEQLEAIKQQLINHINATFPEDKKFLAINQIQNMPDEEFIQFMIQNKMIRTSPHPEQKFQRQIPQQVVPVQNPPKKKIQEIIKKPVVSKNCIFCHISGGTVKAYRLDENKTAVAVLEIHPVTKGHILIIPKEHIESSGALASSTLSLAKKFAKKLKSKFKKAKDVKIVSSIISGHEIINVFPVYDGESLESERLEITQEKLLKLQKRLRKKHSVRKPKPVSKPILQAQPPTPPIRQPSQPRRVEEEIKEVIDESLPPQRIKVQAKPREIHEPTWLPRRIP